MRVNELSLSISGVAGAAPGPRALIERVASLGYRAIQLDAAMSGLRGRDLDRSGRRDIASLFKRLGLVLSGLDLWIPPEHFVDRVNQARAVDAVLDAIALAADVRGPGLDPVVCVMLPKEVSPDVVALVAASSEKNGVPIANHEPSFTPPSDRPIGRGIDPAEIFRIGGDVTGAVASSGASLVSARLSDWNGSRRIAPGSRGGKLDVLAYKAALDVIGFRRPVIVDARDVADPMDVVQGARERWESA